MSYIKETLVQAQSHPREETSWELGPGRPRRKGLETENVRFTQHPEEAQAHVREGRAGSSPFVQRSAHKWPTSGSSRGVGQATGLRSSPQPLPIPP